METFKIFLDIENEVCRQISLWGEQNHPSGTDPKWLELADLAKDKNDKKVNEGNLTWKDILLEELLEALGETSVKELREELIQTAAVCVSWIDSLDRNTENLDNTAKLPTLWVKHPSGDS